MAFGLKLENAESTLKGIAYSFEENFYNNKEYIEDSFNGLMIELEQKQREMLNQLI
jgi:hypothetical protein